MLACRELRALIRSSGCDVVHLHSAKAGFVGRIAALGLDCKVIYSPHAFPFLQDGAIGWLSLWAERALASRMHVLLAVSEAERRLAVDLGLCAADAIRVVPNAIDAALHERRVGPLAPIREPRHTRRFGFVAELRAQKEPMLFLEAVRRLTQGGPRAHFILPARGTMLRPAMEFIERHSLERHITLVPTASSLNAAYRQIDVAVLPSKYEGLPYSLFEALALRRPVITSNIPAFVDILERVDPRLIFRCGDPDSLAQTMALWAELPLDELIEAGLRGRRLVEMEHAFSDWRSAMIGVYREVASSSPQSTPSGYREQAPPLKARPTPCLHTEPAD
jgi:glycosyltransferase involved in cell wall biosynthesis